MAAIVYPPREIDGGTKREVAVEWVILRGNVWNGTPSVISSTHINTIE